MENIKFVTIIDKSGKGISMRPRKAGDKAGNTVEGATMRIHGSRELADKAMTKFWKGRGFKRAEMWPAR